MRCGGSRREERTGEIVRVNACDPLNLAGVIMPGPRVAALHTNAVLYRDGVPVAVEEGKNLVPRGDAGEEALRELQAQRQSRAATVSAVAEDLRLR